MQRRAQKGKASVSRAKILVLLSLLAMILAACSGTSAPTAAGILDSTVQTATLDQVKQAVDNLYTHHPDINSFIVQSVTYTPATRDKVLKICSEGSIATNTEERDSQKVLACAPLIFFFHYYGQQKSVPEAVDVARQLYWYALADKSDATKKVLTDLLRSWGIK